LLGTVSRRGDWREYRPLCWVPCPAEGTGASTGRFAGYRVPPSGLARVPAALLDHHLLLMLNQVCAE